MVIKYGFAGLWGCSDKKSKRNERCFCWFVTLCTFFVLSLHLPHSELLHIQVLVDQNAVGGFQVEFDSAFCFQFDDEECFGTFKCRFVAQVDERRIE